MGGHRNSGYACYTALFANGRLIAINIDGWRLRSVRFRRLDEALVASTRCRGNPSSDFGVRRLILDQFRPPPTSGRRANLKSAWRSPLVMRAKLAREQSYDARPKLPDGVWRPSWPKKSAGAVQSKFSPSKSKRYCGKLKADGNIAAELPCRLLTFTKHLSTCAVAQGAIQSMAAAAGCRTTD
jgi:hypothetical protein